MGKSPGNWFKTALFGKKSSKSILFKDATLNKKTLVTAKAPSKDFDNDSMVISSPVPPVIHVSGDRTELLKTPSVNLTRNKTEVVRRTSGLKTSYKDELIRLEQAATKAQAAVRGYLARRTFWALKGIIRLQALARGQLVRRQAVATLSCMRAIVEFQALARGRKVRLSGDSIHVLVRRTPGEFVDKKRADLLGTSLRSEKLSTNAFGTKLVASLDNTMPLSLQYGPTEPNSVRNWLERWSSSHFWKPIPRLKRVPDAKPKRKQQTKLQPEQTETGRPKRRVPRVPTTNIESNVFNFSGSDKHKPTMKVSSHEVKSMQEQSHTELEKVRHSLRKISVSTDATSEKSDIATEKPPVGLDKASSSVALVDCEQDVGQPFEKVNNLNVVTKESEPAPELHLKEDNLHDVLQDDHHPVQPPSIETDEKSETVPPMNVELNCKEYNSSKENQKTRRKSFPAKQDHSKSILPNTPMLPSYMAATESAKAKHRAHTSAKTAEDGAEYGLIRRHSLPSSTNKLSMQSPRFQKPLQANSKTWTKSTKAQISARDDKTGWKR